MAYGNPSRRLYVLELSDGVVKVGITRGTGEARVKQHRTVLKDGLVRHHIEPTHVTPEAEAAALVRVSRIAKAVRGREWFAGIDFAQAVQIVSQVANEFAHPDPSVEPSPNLRTARCRLVFNDDEIRVLDAYCARFRVERAVACRDLALDAIVDLLSGRHEKNFARPTT